MTMELSGKKEISLCFIRNKEVGFVQVGTILLSGIIVTQSCSKALKGTANLKQYFLCGHKIFKTNFQNSSCCMIKF